ncbi:MAG: HEAT repeat domain-containing protein [Leptolyngbyaceae cyanobacterium MO_188.B28]|nr:HEAT repeat domain-containing protein [Leptolyngbyaceae cyanobacterium MO_188.B28]
MSQLNLEQIAVKLESENLADRMLALVSLEKVPATDAAPLITKLIHDESHQVRSMAISALGRKPTEESYSILVNLLLGDPDYGVRASAAGALGYLEDKRAFEPLVQALYEDNEWLVRFSAVVSLGNLKDPRARDALIQTLDSPEVVLQQAAISALGEIGELSAIDHILKFAQSDDWLTRQRLAEALGNLPGEKSQSALNFLEKDPHPQVSAAASLSLKQLASMTEME